MYKKILILFFLIASVVFSGTIDDSEKYAWGTEIGWINFNPDGGNVEVKNDELTGYIWSKNYGWINLGPDTEGVKNTCGGDLYGYAWGEQIGWIDFENANINKTTGYFEGTAETDNLGMIRFEGDNIAVKTDWNCGIILNKNDLDENTPKGTIVSSLATAGGVEGDIYVYSLVAGIGSEDNSKFEIVDDELKTKFVPDYEIPADDGDGISNNTYSIRIKSSKDGWEYEEIVIITVNDLLDVNNCLSHSIHGYAWSDGIGWINMDCESSNSYIDYGVDVDKDGNLTGFAWSDTVGWIDFEYYDDDQSPKYNVDTKKLEGAVKALGGLKDSTDGWNGKIQLSGTADSGYPFAPVYDPATYEYDEFAWGDSFLGWIDFKTNFGVVTMDPFYFRFTANKGKADDPVLPGGSVVLSWTTYGVSSCVASEVKEGTSTTWIDNINKSVGEPNTASETIYDLDEDVKFKLTCEDLFHNIVTKEIDVRVAPERPIVSLYVDDDNIPSGSSTGINWNVENVDNCVATSSSGTWDKSIDSSDGLHSDSTGNLTESANWFKVKCDSVDPEYYPRGVEEIVWVNVEKLELEFYPENNPIKYNDKIKLYWVVQFAQSCTSEGDLEEFNNALKDVGEGLHSWESINQDIEGKEFYIKMKCIGTAEQNIIKILRIRVGNNPRYQEV